MLPVKVLILMCVLIYARGNKKDGVRNVLLIVADDAGFEIGAYGNRICQTPNIDALAKKSLIFNKAFTSVSSCSPSRSAILSGLPAHQNGMYGLHNGVHHFNSFKFISLPLFLSTNKIRTGIIGKKHVGPRKSYHFDYEQTEENHSILQVGRNITYIKLLVKDFLSHNTTQPFFLYIGFHDPHRCGHTQPQYGDFCEKYGSGEPGMGRIDDWVPIIYEPSQVQVPYYIQDTPAARMDIAAQYTTISRLDQGVGLVLQELKRAGFDKNTLVILTSDNAIPFPAGRTNLYDSGLSVPLLISSPWHMQRHNQVTNSLTSLLDIAPTILDWFKLSGLNHDSLTGHSLLPLLTKEPPPDNETVYASHSLHEITMYYPMRAVRTHRYKLIHNINYGMPFPIDQDFFLSPSFQDLLNRSRKGEPLYWYRNLNNYYYRPQWQLFDLRYDPEELTNLAYNHNYSDIKSQLQEKLYNWMKETDDPWLCAPSGVLEDKGYFKMNPHCFSVNNKT